MLAVNSTTSDSANGLGLVGGNDRRFRAPAVEGAATDQQSLRCGANDAAIFVFLAFYCGLRDVRGCDTLHNPTPRLDAVRSVHSGRVLTTPQGGDAVN